MNEDYDINLTVSAYCVEGWAKYITYGIGIALVCGFVALGIRVAWVTFRRVAFK